ncbi:hypothetical protein M5G22_18085 [Pseudomonas sp. TNT2022 ID233]|uniref:hypothetical protein n=1 Tax=Pseudomonas aphyarum TaxID=2942629 RepID=UPI0023615E55|nr:hypothetical protein [Pseudomonas aphyarum]MDD1139471.1 hypothetical protein [Pseudomonas aphyarum]
MQLVQNESFLEIDSSELAKRQKLDQAEKAGIALTLSAIAQNHAPSEDVDLHYTTVPCVSGTTFDHAIEYARVALLKMLKTDDFLFLADVHSLSADAVVYVDEHARLFVQDQGSWRDLTNDRSITAELRHEMGILADCAEQTGGYIFSAGIFGVGQWLRFHDYTLPTTVADTRQLIAWLEFQLPASPVTGDYHELLMAPADSAFHLSATQRQTIRQIAKDTTKGRFSLLQHIVTPDFKSLAASSRREQAAVHLDNFLQTPEAGALGIYLHDRLGWHLDEDREVASRQIKCMVATALILDLGIEVERHAKVIAGFQLYHPDNASKTAPQVVEAFEWQLTRELQLDPLYTPLAAHLLLAGAAPQLLVQQTPAELAIGKPGWVIVSQAVAMIELTAPGTTRLMTYDRVKAFSELAPVSKAQRTLHELTTITPIIQWAMLNGILPATADKDDDVNAFTTAASRFSQFVEALNDVETGIAIVPPDRRELALQELKRVMPEGLYLEQQVFKANFDLALGERNFLEWAALFLPTSEGNVAQTSDVGRLRVSILDLYMSGDLVVNGKLTDRFVVVGKFNPPTGAYSRLSELKPIDSIFNKAFEQYYLALKKCLSSILKMAVANLPEHDRTIIANGFITLYTVRKAVNPLNPFQETPRQRNAAKGRYGIILGCQHGKSFRCYELFSLRGLCRERPELADMLRASGVVYEEPSLSYEGADTDFLPKNLEQQWPLDFDAYMKGSDPKQGVSSRVVVEKLWNFALVSDETQPVPLFFSRAFDALAEGVLGNHPVATREELYSSLYAPTALQRIRTSNDQVNEAIINVIVPFKKCIEDIRSGDAEQVSEGIGGCILDGLALLGLVVGFGATIAGIVGKTTSTTAKALSLAKAGAHFSVSIFNPLDGFPALAVQGGRLARKGVLLLSKHGLNAMETATSQLRKLTGSAQSYDLVKAAQKSDLFEGTWKAVDNLGDPVNLLALQRNSDWYALNLRVGGAWGPKLRNLKVSPLAPLRRLFGRAKPFSYTQGYVKKALPAAKSKLDNATLMLLDNDNADMRAILKHVFGNDSDEVLRHVKNNLQDMRKDLDFITPANMSFSNGSEALAALRPETYRRWKASILDGSYLKNPPEQFLLIYPEGLDEFYRLTKHDDGRIGDVLIHELAHGAPDTLDLYYGKVKGGHTAPAEFDVAGLLQLGSAKDTKSISPDNLANLQHARAYGEGLAEFDAISASLPDLVRRHPALHNADSYSLAVSLLNQARIHPEGFLLNLDRIRRGIKNTSNLGFIKGSLRVNLSSASF